jgi:hypothetical protein
MPQLAEVGVVTSVVVMDEMSWSTVGGHKIGHWFASLGSRGRGRRKAAAVAAAAAAANSANNGVANNNTTRSFTLGKRLQVNRTVFLFFCWFKLGSNPFRIPTLGISRLDRYSSYIYVSRPKNIFYTHETRKKKKTKILYIVEKKDKETETTSKAFRFTVRCRLAAFYALSYSPVRCGFAKVFLCVSFLSVLLFLPFFFGSFIEKKRGENRR